MNMQKPYKKILSAKENVFFVYWEIENQHSFLHIENVKQFMNPKAQNSWSLFYYLKKKLNTNLSIAVKGSIKCLQLDMKNGQWYVYKKKLWNSENSVGCLFYCFKTTICTKIHIIFINKFFTLWVEGVADVSTSHQTEAFFHSLFPKLHNTGFITAVIRSSNWRCSIKKAVHEHFAICTGKNLTCSLFLKFKACNFIISLNAKVASI